MTDRFKELVKSTISGDEEAITTIQKNIKLIVSQYFSKKYIEISWIADKEGICCPSKFFDYLFAVLLHKVKYKRETICTFHEYKEFIISIANKKISKLFHNYYYLLFKNDKRAWKEFDKLLKIRIKCWLNKKGFPDVYLYEQFYQEAQLIFLNKLHKDELYFKDSRLLKSYIFKIINMKLLEFHREKKNVVFTNINYIELDFSDDFNQNIHELDKEQLILNLFKNLNKLEKSILFEVFFMENKLKDIAKKLELTEANCRVIKHRALVKLEKPANLYGYI